MQTHVQIQATSSLSGISSRDFDDLAQKAFIRTVASVTTFSNADDITITSITDVLDVLDRPLSKRKYLRKSVRVLDWGISVDWSIAIVLESTTFSNTSTLLSVFTKSIETSISSGNFSQMLTAQSPRFANSTVKTAVSDEIKITIAKTSFPSSVPSSQPTQFRSSSRFSNFSATLYTSVFVQFSFFMGAVIFICICIPSSFYCYDLRGLQKQVKMAKEQRRVRDKTRMEQAKSLLADEEIARRENIRKAYRERYGRDIDIFADCASTTHDDVGSRAGTGADPQMAPDECDTDIGRGGEERPEFNHSAMTDPVIVQSAKRPSLTRIEIEAYTPMWQKEGEFGAASATTSTTSDRRHVLLKTSLARAMRLSHTFESPDKLVESSETKRPSVISFLSKPTLDMFEVKENGQFVLKQIKQSPELSSTNLKVERIATRVINKAGDTKAANETIDTESNMRQYLQIRKPGSISLREPQSKVHEGLMIYNLIIKNNANHRILF